MRRKIDWGRRLLTYISPLLNQSRVRAIDPSAAGYENVVDNLATLVNYYHCIERRTYS